uniref:Putative secreted protein n=1 Tax=Ixodes ricinus TaxID=34613 RepID=A0A6B0V983_IXORI
MFGIVRGLDVFVVAALFARCPCEEHLGQGGLKDVQHALAGLVPRLGAELGPVGDHQVLQAVGARTRQLLVVLLDAPVKLDEEVVEQQVSQHVVVLGEDVHDGVQGVVAGGGHPLRLLVVPLGQLHVVEDAEDDLKQVLPPVGPERGTVRLHHLEHHRQGACPDVQLAPVDDAGELEEDGEPAAHPDPVLLGHRLILHVVVPERLGLLRHVLGAVPDQPDRLHRCVRKAGVACKLRQALDRVLKGVHECEEVPSVGLGDNAPRCLESELHNALVPVRGRQVEHAEDVLPARLDVGRLGVDHLCHAAHHHVPDGGRPVALDDVLEGPQEVLLEPEVGKLALLNELHRQLSQGVEGEEGHVL